MAWPRWLPEPFITALLGAVVLAALLPAHGVIALWVDGLVTAAIMLLFFMHGVKLPRDALWAALVNWRLHGAIVATTFVLFPMLGLGLHFLLPGLLTPALWLGMLFLCALPSTVQSSIAFTSIARGNVAAAVTAAGLSNLLGMALTPLIAGLLIGTRGGDGISLDQFDCILWQLFLPFVAGQLLRPLFIVWVSAHKGLVSLTDRSTIIMAVYAAFSAAVVGGIWSQVGVSELAMLMGLCSVLLALVMGIGWWASRLAGIDRVDRIAMLMAGSKKSLAAGVPMAKVLLPVGVVGMALLPLMIFHQIQLIVCAILARRLGREGV